jgi:hypothetical protein
MIARPYEMPCVDQKGYRLDGGFGSSQATDGLHHENAREERFCIRCPKYLQEQPDEKPGDFVSIENGAPKVMDHHIYPNAIRISRP